MAFSLLDNSVLLVLVVMLLYVIHTYSCTHVKYIYTFIPFFLCFLSKVLSSLLSHGIRAYPWLSLAMNSEKSRSIFRNWISFFLIVALILPLSIEDCGVGNILGLICLILLRILLKNLWNLMLQLRAIMENHRLIILHCKSPESI